MSKGKDWPLILRPKILDSGSDNNCNDELTNENVLLPSDRSCFPYLVVCQGSKNDV